ncbi:phosphatase PAP2 family protein [Phyllobacterium myrsinacearum]|uniref:Membrane-associated phospholipid phosphatase n=1 Tax=Phyllobacterium myrsinacearum TaxID=28101 RepID=A0A839ENC1_9HYPH|nr:phosphatase PAP2 family protein [Phyllobacterium myrsinacearum]MBA8880359.1 membrane-associated phospholipid phosphatase [Phyllobacterium myrsinacearum]
MRSDIQTLWKASIVTGILLIDAVWIVMSDFQFDTLSALKAIILTGICGGIAYIYHAKRPMRHFNVMCVETAVLVAFSAAAAVLSYLVTSLDFPAVDAELVRLDALFGFDWLAYARYVGEHPSLGLLFSFTYVTTLVQVAFAVIVFGVMGDVKKAQHFVAAVMAGALVCILISAILPAAGALATIRPAETLWGIHRPVVDLAYKQTFFDLRSGVEQRVSLYSIKGLIAFPSYHGTLSVLLVLAFCGVRIWFLPILLLNIIILIATPIEGGHHLVDVIAGVGVALLCWYGTGLFYRSARLHPAGKASRPVMTTA